MDRQSPLATSGTPRCRSGCRSAEVHAQGAYADDRLPCVACRVLVQSMGNMA